MRLEEKKSIEVFSNSVSIREFFTSVGFVGAGAIIPLAICFIIPEELAKNIGLYIICFVWIACLFFYPSFIAFDFFSRFENKGFHKVKHPQRLSILLLNIFFAWTIFGWFLILYWALKIPEIKLEKKVRIKTIKSISQNNS